MTSFRSFVLLCSSAAVNSSSERELRAAIQSLRRRLPPAPTDLRSRAQSYPLAGQDESVLMSSDGFVDGLNQFLFMAAHQNINVLEAEVEKLKEENKALLKAKALLTEQQSTPS